MLLPLPTPAEMAVWDRETIHTIGIPGVTLMESASREAVNVLLEEYGDVGGAVIHCFAGSGNNGGDAFAVARHLNDLGAEVTVFHTRPKRGYRGETRTNLLWAQRLGIPLVHLAGVRLDTLAQPDIIVDGLLGTGFAGALREDFLQLVRTVNRLGERAFVLAVDIPSGLNGLTGRPQPEAVRADATATFQAPKLGLVLPEAQPHTGALHVCPIGIPLMIQEKYQTRHRLITGEVMAALPAPAPDMHKGSAGHVLVVGGSFGLTGAPHLAALAALRSGAGLATVACPAGLADAVKAGSPDIMTLPLGAGTAWTGDMAEAIKAELHRFDAVVLGPGMGRTPEARSLALELAAGCGLPMVLDADALFALAASPEHLRSLPEQAVLTPHPGEMARLLDTATAEVQADRLGAVDRFLAACDATLVLKGAGTLVADRDMTCVSPFAEPNLSVGGAGDVLSGVVGALLAGGLSPMRAACTGVFWHGLAGRALNNEFPARGNLASEIANMLPHAAAAFTKEPEPC
ncbi:carbohydrate kinase, YjeF related protein [Pseudodesulfovibrio mercurii]|uniref:Bifunctional NAD(P)H-hydrate repair enzyme n=1 Tax=Pseudodesulfovibrio mercurii TaxID=641491 RepID=F0JET8_9BACT|nr:bifunctional ADP-dependent NAD(P)H-hydrate dehydratase/NAD(P)H-hydrate epimerase [Pseudodesulfovibrio mercurii]EGB13573.1 carbohydrate kinase, YjeF related protein [Pseudodesulfovibrio mercurii]